MTPEELLQMDLAAEGEGVWVPTPHGRFLADTLAEHNLVRDREVLELGGGVGNHTIILARQQPKRLVVTEIVASFLESTRRNVERNVENPPPMEFRVADWLDTPGEFDVVITNPPFAKSGKRNRRYFIDSLILDAHKRLRPGGSLVFIQSSMADIAKTQTRLAENGYSSRILGSRSGPFRDYYFDDPTFLEEARRVENGFEDRDGTLYETLHVVEAKLEAWTPPAFAHVPPPTDA